MCQSQIRNSVDFEGRGKMDAKDVLINSSVLFYFMSGDEVSRFVIVVRAARTRKSIGKVQKKNQRDAVISWREPVG